MTATMTNMRLALIALMIGGSTTFGAMQDDRNGVPLEPGLTFRIYDIGRPLDRLAPLRADQTPNVDRRLDQLDLPDNAAFGGPADHFVVEAFGYLEIVVPGDYTFALTSDDGSRLMINGNEIIRHDGVHPATTKEGACALEAGLHPWRVEMFENGGGAALSLAWRPPGAAEFTLVPADAFRIEKGVTRVVSPGRKILLDGREHLKPGDGMPLETVHPAWTLETLRPDGFEPQVGGMAFLPDGRLVVSSFPPVNNGVFREQPNGVLYVLDHLDDAPDGLTIDVIADDLHDPCGVAVVDGDIYVSHRPDITRFMDTDGDGVFESREVFVAPWVSDNYHHFSFGLVEHDGWLYGTLSTSIYFENTLKADNVEGEVVSMNGPNPAHRGTCYRVNLESRDVEFLAGGFRTPNGIWVTDDGRILVSDNQGAWLPASKLVQVEPGAFYGHHNGTQSSERYPDGGVPALHADQPPSPPALWLPQNEICNSPTNPLPITDGPFAGQFYLGELTMGGIRRFMLETVDGGVQGAAFRHTQGFEAGVNRIIHGPDGCLYVGGTGANGNWTWRGTQFGLQRLRPTGASAFEMHAINIRPDGFLVSFTDPIDDETLRDPARYTVTQWRYHPTPQYGGPKYDLQRLPVASATPNRTGETVHLAVPGLRAGSVVHLRTDLRRKADEAELWSKEAWYTLNRFPGGRAMSEATRITLPRSDDVEDAFRTPFGAWAVVDDVRMDPSAPRRLAAQEETGIAGGNRGVLWNGPDGRAPDLMTHFEHGDVEVDVEFMVPRGSNSGVYLMGRYEIQILDSFGKDAPQHDDCGGKYQRWDPSRGRGNEGFEGVPPRTNAARPAGQWQRYEILFRAPRFDETGRKVENARFVRVVHNGRVIHENVELTGPTRAGFDDEVPYGPLRLQGDHGPVAYRNLRVRLLEDASDASWR